MALPAFLPTSMESLIPVIIQILYSTLTVWLSATFVTKKSPLQNALIFSAVSYVILILIRFLPIPSIPIVSVVIAAEIAIKSLLAMKFFDADFREGVSIAGVQTIIELILRLPF